MTTMFATIGNRAILTALGAGMLLATSVAGHAQGGDEVNCDDAATQPELTFCAHREYEEADAELNRIWHDMVAYAKNLDEEVAPVAKERGLPTTLEALRAAQRAWIAFRDAQCQFESYDAFGGTAQPMVGSLCLAQVTRDRVASFKLLLEDQR